MPKNQKIKDLNSPRKNPLIVLGYWSKKTEEYFHRHNSDNINLCDKSTTQDVTNVLTIILNNVNYMEQGMIELQ